MNKIPFVPKFCFDLLTASACIVLVKKIYHLGISWFEEKMPWEMGSHMIVTSDKLVEFLRKYGVRCSI